MPKKAYALTPTELNALPISPGEAKKLLGASGQAMSEDDVARKILLLAELARVLVKTLDLQ